MGTHTLIRTLLTVAVMAFSAAASAQTISPTVVINTPEFLDDIEDGISLQKQIALNVAVAAPESAETSYSYKFGTSGSCQSSNGFSTWRSTSLPLPLDVDSILANRPNAKQVQLCIKGRYRQGNRYIEGRRRDILNLRWRIVGARRTVIIAPTGVQTTTTPTVQWRETLGVVSYDLYVATDSSCSSPIQSFEALTSTSQVLEPLSDGTYYACVFANVDRQRLRRLAALNNGFQWEQAAGNLPGGFAILTPASPSTQIDPILSWTASLDADTYTVQVSVSSDCSSPVINVSSVAGTSLALTGLADGNYYACVSASNTAGQTLASNAPYAWRQQTQAPGAFAIVAPTNPSADPTPVVMWQASTAADSYTLIVSTVSDCSVETQRFDGLTGTSQQLATLLDDDYFACVTAVNPAGSTLATYSWTQLTQAPGAFSITGPVSPSTTNIPTVTWTASAAADTYNLVIGTDAACATPVQSFNGLTALSQQLNPLADGAYFACLTAINTIGSTDADNFGFTWDQITEAPGPFTILSPSMFIATADPEINWDVSAGAVSYSVAIGFDAACTQTVESAPQVFGTAYAVSALAEGTYYTCVTANNAAGSTAASNNGLQFTYDVTGPEAFAIDPIPVQESHDFVISWSPAEGAHHYSFFVMGFPDCTSSAMGSADILLTSFEGGGLGNGTYYACASAFDEAGNETVADNNGLAFTIAVPEGEPQHIFVSSMELTPRPNQQIPSSYPIFGRVAGADYVCTGLAINAGLYTEEWDGVEVVYKALLATPDEDLIDRISGFRTTLYNMRGEEIESGLAQVFGGNILNAVRYDELGNEVTFNPFVWTGADDDGTYSGADCGAWEDSTVVGTIGDIRATDSTWLNAGTRSCFQNARVYCVSP